MRNQVLHDRYEMLCRDTSLDIYEHLPTFVNAVEELKATKVIELGVRYGVSTIAWLYALEDAGHLWSVDCSFPVAAPGSDVNLLDPQGPLGVVSWWTFLLGYDSWEPVLDALPTEVDLVFIDTQHTFEQTLLELELYFPRVRSGGRIYLHDTAILTTGNAVTPQPDFPVKTAMEEFCILNDLKWENNPNCFGLGTVYAP
jgi:predicted O-methyltransferase YrrM